MQKIVPCVWFDGVAEDAAGLYARLIPDSHIDSVARYGEAGFEFHGQPAGRAMTVDAILGGYRVLGLNGGPQFRLTPAISLFVTLDSEDEANRIWQGLVDGGSVLMPLDSYPWSPKYGWLNDRFGLSWQVYLGQRDAVGQTISPLLMFVGAVAGRAEEAIGHYTSVFPDSRIEGIARYDGSGPDPADTVMHAQVRLGGETLMAMDSALAHDFGFSEALSLIILCDSQEEIDHYWESLSAVPEAERCGWLKDRFGVSWQVVPRVLPTMLQDPDPAKAARVTEAMMQMKKLDIAALEKARAG